MSAHPELLSEHLADLRKSGLSDETIAAMRCRSLDPGELTAALGCTLTGVKSALAIPYLDDTISSLASPPPPFARYKLFPPVRDKNGKDKMRYAQPAGSGVHLYILPAVRLAFANTKIRFYWTEGEKKAARATQEGLHCAGLGGLWNWLESGTADGIAELDAIAHVQRDEIIVPDSDVWTRPDLLRAVYAFGRELEARGARVSVPILPSSDGGKVGLDDFLVAKGAGAFRELESIPLRDSAFTKQREWYPGWKASRTKLAAVDAKQAQGGTLTFTDPEPWPSPVEGNMLLTELAATYRRYVVMPPAAAEALALWTVHTYCVLPCFDSPYVSVSGPTMRCGKTRTLEMAECVVHRPLLTTAMTAATLFRTIEVHQPTLLIDEKDADPRMKEELRGLLNAGNRAGSRVPRCVGDTNEVRWFSVFCPKAIAGIGRLHGTTEDRSIPIRLRRRTALEPLERFRRDRVHAACELLRRMATRWAQDNLEALREADPAASSQLNDRAADNWRSLLAIADLAGGDWSKRARLAAVVLSGEDPTADDDIGVQLLADLRGIFGGEAHASTEALLAGLNAMADRPWPEWSHGKPLTARGLARLLKPFGIGPKTVRLSPTNTPKGYDRADFEDAFSRYLPAEKATAPQPAPAQEKGEVPHPPPRGECGPSVNATSPYSDKACGGVADGNGASHRDSCDDPSCHGCASVAFEAVARVFPGARVAPPESCDRMPELAEEVRCAVGFSYGDGEPGTWDVVRRGR